MYTCADCAALACENPQHKNMPQNCPIRNENLNGSTLEKYATPENKPFFLVSSEIESIGYGKWPRLKEIIEFCKHMDYSKVGIAFCSGLKKEAKVINSILKSHGLEVVSVICKAGGISKERVAVPEKHKLQPGQYEPMCNPIGQAAFLNEQHTQFNIVVGLCVGHDSLFYKYSEAFVTTLIAKDRVLAHNPAGAVYCAEGYYKKKLAPESED